MGYNKGSRCLDIYSYIFALMEPLKEFKYGPKELNIEAVKEFAIVGIKSTEVFGIKTPASSIGSKPQTALAFISIACFICKFSLPNNSACLTMESLFQWFYGYKPAVENRCFKQQDTEIEVYFMLALPLITSA